MAAPDLSELISTKTIWMRRLRAYITPTLFLIYIVSKYLLGLPFPLVPILVITAIVFFYNGFFVFLESESRELSVKGGTAFATVRVVLDLFFLACVVHFTGGMHSPFIFFYLFSVLGYCIATGEVVHGVVMSVWGVVTYAGVLVLEMLGMISHFPLVAADASYSDVKLIMMNILVFSAALLILVFMVTYLVKLLENKEIEVISKDAEMRKTRDFLDATFNAADDLIWVIDEKGDLLEVNDKFLSLVGMSYEEVIGRNISETFASKEAAQTMISDGKKLARGEDLPPYEMVMTAKDGRDIPFEIRASLIKGDGQVLIARDITAYKEHKKEIAEKNRTLERELEEVKRLNTLIVGTEEEMARLKEELKKTKPH